MSEILLKSQPKSVRPTDGPYRDPYESPGSLPQTPEKDGSTKVGDSDSVLEFDAAGTELGKEARVWKVYVKESDRWDAELIDGWNRSLDVILVFAALFSAISTAFLVEVSGSLREGKPDVTTQALMALTMAVLEKSSIQLPGSLPWSDLRAETSSPSPSRTDVLINTLWFLSLSLSVLTSFLAMLAKDWCHSFMAGRTGHPYIQTRRRQQKLMMIEKWKMQELITLLPSLIHISLLLFTVGLCIYVWELSTTVAIPVVCASSLAWAFYVWSGIMATLIDFFPYTTIVSRILLSDGARYCYATLGSLLQYTLPLTWRISDFGGRCLLFILDLTYKDIIPGRFKSWRRRLKKQRDLLRRWLSRLYLVAPPKPRSQVGAEEDMITSLALSWLISNCEEPSAVDAALQAISGASHLVREPLEKCEASLEISRRLVSKDIYTKTNSPLISLYARALSYLNTEQSALTKLSAGAQNQNPGEREVLMWRLQDTNNNMVASLITDGRFMPTKHNFDALRIGCTSSERVLEQMGAGSPSTRSSWSLLRELLEEYHKDEQILHPAALLALLNAGFLLTTCFPNFSELELADLDITHLAAKLLHKNLTVHGEEVIQSQLGIALIAYIVLKAELALSHYSPEYNTRHLEDSLHQIVKRLSQWSHNPRYEKGIIWLGVSVISSNPAEFSFQTQSWELHKLQEWVARSYYSAFECLPSQHDHRINHTAILEYMETLNDMYTPVIIGTPAPQIYYFVVESMCRELSSGYDIWESCGKLLSKFCFPKLSPELVDWLANEERSIISVLRRSLNPKKKITIQFLAASQLWCLYTLCSVTTVEGRHEQANLESLLDRRSSGRTQTQALGRVELALKIKECWEAEKAEICKWLGVYAYRVLECLLEAANHPSSSPEHEEIAQGLNGVPLGLRGLDSLSNFETLGHAQLSEELRPRPLGIFMEARREEGSNIV